MKQILIFTFFLSAFSSFGQSENNEISDSDKIVGLSKLWSEVKYNFANFDVSKINWDSTYQAYIPKVLATKTPEAYYKELMTMMALLKDGHSNVYYKPFFDYKRPPIRTKLIEDKIIITDIYNDTLRTQKVEIGDEIVEINHQDATDFATKNVMPFQSASTVQDLNIRTFTYSLLTGKADELVELKIRKKGGQTFLISMSRKLTSSYKKQTYELNITKDNIAHLKINDFENEKYKEIFDSLYVKILPTKALIIDLRNNGGGDSGQGFYILSHLIERNAYGAKSKTKQYIPTLKAWEQPEMWMEFSPDIIKPIEGKQKYLKPVVLLMSAKTYSAAEDLTVAFDVAKRGIKIGQATGGSTGQPLFFDLTKNGFARICTKKDTYPDGKEFIGIGIKPDVEVKETVLSIQEHKDPTLEKAIESLTKK